jgi:hypothetical protein
VASVVDSGTAVADSAAELADRSPVDGAEITGQPVGRDAVVVDDLQLPSLDDQVGTLEVEHDTSEWRAAAAPWRCLPAVSREGQLFLEPALLVR